MGSSLVDELGNPLDDGSPSLGLVAKDGSGVEPGRTLGTCVGSSSEDIIGLFESDGISEDVGSTVGRASEGGSCAGGSTDGGNVGFSKEGKVVGKSSGDFWDFEVFLDDFLDDFVVIFCFFEFFDGGSFFIFIFIFQYSFSGLLVFCELLFDDFG